ncbi:MAG: hypothetical protein PHY62_00510 [Gallionella sp.]|nr:hypothetical protein [Gallionella sp.]
MNSFITRVLALLKPQDNMPPEIRRAKQLIAAIDAGGVPLDPSIIRKIAQSLGLEVTKKARMEDTIHRIRVAIERY